jgi:hypothetical protein
MAKPKTAPYVSPRADLLAVAKQVVDAIAARDEIPALTPAQRADMIAHLQPHFAIPAEHLDSAAAHGATDIYLGSLVYHYDQIKRGLS